MDPVSAIEGIVSVAKAVNTLLKKLMEYKPNINAVEGLLRFLENMQLVLKEQRQDRVPPSGLRILLAIKGECAQLETTANTFLQRNIVIKLGTVESTVDALQQARVNLNEHWTLYLVSISAAGAGSSPALRAKAPTDNSCTGLVQEHFSHFSRAVDAMNSGDRDASSAQRHLRALSCHPPGRLSDEQENHLSVAVMHVQRQLSVPTDAFTCTPSAPSGSGLLKHLEAMREAMVASMSSGVAVLQSQLQEIVLHVSEQNEAIAHGNEKVLSEMKGVREVCMAMAYGVKAPLKPEDRELLDRFSAGVEKEEQCVFDQNIMACPITRLPFKPGCDREPTLVPGCHCTVSRAVAEMFQEEGQCGVCQEAVPDPDEEELRPDRVALRFLDDLNNNRLPAIRKFDVEHDFREEGERGMRHGMEGVVRFGMLRGEPVAVKTVDFATTDASQRQWRCRRHVLLNSICTQHRAARASEFVCDVVGLCWGKSCAHIAMPVFTCTLEDHVQRDATRGMPVHRVLELCCALTRAVHDVHACGIMHCDINPANVLLAEDGTPRLIDFGLSHVARDGLKTRTSMGFTLQYAPKEQSEGGRVNEASDVYALGRTLAYAATGMRPSRRGQRMPTEPPELAKELLAMTDSEEKRKAVRLVQVIATFEGLLAKYGPTPVQDIHTADALASRLQFGGAVDLGSREVLISNGDPSHRVAVQRSVKEDVISEYLSINVWTLGGASEEAAPRDTVCWELDQAAAELCNATLVVPSGGQLHVLNVAGAGTWKGVTVRGEQESTVVITGELQLDTVIFDSCTLIATQASNVTAVNSTFKNCPVAVAASGEGTSVILRGCTISDCQDGVVVTGGAAVAVTDKCTITSKNNGSCIAAHGVGSSATVLQSALECTGGSRKRLWCGCVAALHGGSVRLEGPNLTVPPKRGWAGGVLSCGQGSVATVVGCDVSVSEFGVWAASGGAADVRGCNVTGSKRGLFVTDPASRIEAAECAVAGCADNCADVRLGGHLSLKSCSLCSSEGQSGVSLVSVGSEAVLKECTINGNAGWGVAVMSGANVTATSCTAEKNGRDGMYVWDGATAELSECKFMFSKRGGGLIVGGPKSHAKASRCEFSNNVSDGARAMGGGILHALACQAFQNGSKENYQGMSTRPFASRGHSGSSSLEKPPSRGASGSTHIHSSHMMSSGEVQALDASACGFHASSAESKIILESHCSATHNCAGGFVAAHGARIEASDSRSGQNGGPGAAVRCKASGEFLRCQFKGSCMASGVEVHDGGASATLTECTATDNAVSGVCVQDGASLAISVCEAAANKLAGLYLDGVESQANAAFFTAARNGCGVLVHQRARLEAADCKIEDNEKKGLHVHSCGKAIVRRSWVCGTTDGDGVVVADSDSHVTLVSCSVTENHGYGGLVQEDAKLEVWGSTAPSNFAKNRLANVRVETRGDARVKNCFLRGSVDRSGLNVDGEGASATVADCTLADNALCGIIVQNQATVQANKVTVDANIRAGVHVQTAAQAELRALKVAGCPQGSGLLVHGPGSIAKVTDYVATNNSESGIDAQMGGKVVATSGRTDGNSVAGVAVDGSSTVELRICTSTDKKPYKAPKLKGCLVRKQCTPG